MLKKIVSIVVLCAFLLVSVLVAVGEKADEAVIESISAEDRGAFGFEVLEKIYESGENTVFSPVSLEIALSMAADGANGETLAEILVWFRFAEVYFLDICIRAVVKYHIVPPVLRQYSATLSIASLKLSVWMML